MSEGNVETARLAFEAVRDRRWDEVVRWFYPGAEWHNTRDFPGPDVCRGADEIIAFWRALFDSFGEGEMVLERVADAGDLVVHGIHSRSTGKASGVPIDVHWAVVHHMVGGRIARTDVYGSFERAAAAAGLPGT